MQKTPVNTLRQGDRPATTAAAPAPGGRIIVVGCPRSGTSLFAKLLVASGLRTTPDPRRDVRYPAGYFEHMPILMFNKAMERVRGPKHRVTAEPFLRPEDLADEFTREMFERAYEPILSGRVDFIKCPLLALASELLFERFAHLHLIALWRAPKTTFHSMILKEFGGQGLVVRGIRGVLTWNRYAEQIVAAKRLRPEEVTVLNIDDLVEENASLEGLLARLGHAACRPVRIGECVDTGQWRRSVPLRWASYFALMKGMSRLGRGLLRAEVRHLVNTPRWQRSLREVTEDAATLAAAPEGATRSK